MNNRFHTLWMSICIFEKILDDVHNPRMTDRHQAPAYPLRLPAELKAEITKAAFVARRSFNAEVTERLATSLNAPPLPASVQIAVQREIERNGGSATDALTRLVEAGEQRSGLVLNLSVQKGMSVQDLSKLVQELAQALPAETEVILRTPSE